MKEKIWALMVYLSENQWISLMKDKLNFDDSFWDYILKKSSECGINTILLEVGDGVKFETHPEISLPDAWSHARVRKEVKKCREFGIALIPKLNFSSAHNFWMKEWRNMTSSKPYYDFCRDIIQEIYEMFERPEYIHIGYDEEVPLCCFKPEIEYQIMRKGKLLMDDFKFLIDEVNKTGAKPWAWYDPLWDHAEDYFKYMNLDEEVVLSPWYYMGLKKEHFQPLSKYNSDGTENELYKQGFRFVEHNPAISNATGYWFSDEVLKVMKHGFKYIPTPSVYCNDNNTDDMVEYFKNGAPDEQIFGYLTAPWVSTVWENKETIDKSVELLAAARKKYYGE